MTEIKQIERLKLLEQKVSLLNKTKEIEQGRNDVLRMVAQGADLEHVLDTLCHNTQRYNEKILCSVLRFDAKQIPYIQLLQHPYPNTIVMRLRGFMLGQVWAHVEPQRILKSVLLSKTLILIHTGCNIKNYL